MKKNFRKDTYSTPQSYPCHSSFAFDKSTGGSYGKNVDSSRDFYDFDNRWDDKENFSGEYDGDFDKGCHSSNKFEKCDKHCGDGQWGKHCRPCNSRPVCCCKVCSVRKFCCCKRVNPCHRRFFC